MQRSGDGRSHAVHALDAPRNSEGDGGFLDDVESSWDESEAATYAVRPREGSDAGEFAGVTALSCEWKRQTGDLGLWLRKPFWGRGYSGERATALLDLAFKHLDLDIVAVTHHVDNEQSRRAIEKYAEAHGGRREGVLWNWRAFDGEVRYTVTRPEYCEAAVENV